MAAPVAVPAPLALPANRPADTALDDQALFETGLEHIQALAHRVWTDHNVHDPGITTLELLCYALTDLAYRAALPIPDLLAESVADPSTQLFTARRILTSRPLTIADYRKLLIDLEGVENAWVRPTTETYFADTIRGELRRDVPADDRGIIPVPLQGLYDVLIAVTGDVTSAADREAVQRRAMATLQANRNLGEDFVSIALIQPQQFIVCAELELEPSADVAATHAKVLFAVEQYLDPPVAQYGLEEMLARTRADGTAPTVDEIFDGPALVHGFIDDDELAAADLRADIRLSDVIRVVMGVPGVIAVRDILVTPAPEGDAPPEALLDKWVVPVLADRQAQLDWERCRLVCYKRGMPFVAEPATVDARRAELEAVPSVAEKTVRADDLPIPAGRARNVARYYSFQNHFPVTYGLSELGIVGPKDDRRVAQARQLEGYLLLFDQLMADFQAQLAAVGELFSYSTELASEEQTRSYFHQLVAPDALRGVGEIYADGLTVDALSAAVDDATEQTGRRNRFLDHLIARVAERFHDFAEIMRSQFGTSAASMIGYKCDFLRDYARTSAERGLAYDYTRQDDGGLWDSDNISGLERRLARLLGILNPTRRNLSSVAYDIYAEIDKTPNDEFRFRVRQRDSQKIVLSGTTHYATRDLARAAMRRAIGLAMSPASYVRKQASDGRNHFEIVDETGDVVARRIEYFATVDLMNAAIAALITYLRTQYSDEGMYVIEHVLLRPDPGQANDPFLPICPDPNCTDCADEDPYSYRIQIVLPAFSGRFTDMKFRRWAEQVIRAEVPAHIQPKICWIGRDDMAELEKRYRDWIYLRAGRETANRTDKLTQLRDTLFRVKNVYPTQQLFECDAPETQQKFILGQTALGTLGNTNPGS